ncbi:hypothetical protein GCM10010435_57760 [Winogradskya consettensis]|uniref:Uncharacterized protein n=1 Tax=Winogradskya consettensis TaxID=113560 RepID=A0A919S964_9ACTN|nr:hypothetical protein Aco04nite_04560 [Actinoplanes consettensis]
MLYPLSYEGLRPISYLAGDIHECPGVPSGAHRCRLVNRWGFVAVRRTCRANFAHTRFGVPGGDRGRPALMGAIRSPSTFRALSATLSWENISPDDLMFARGRRSFVRRYRGVRLLRQRRRASRARGARRVASLG